MVDVRVSLGFVLLSAYGSKCCRGSWRDCCIMVRQRGSQWCSLGTRRLGLKRCDWFRTYKRASKAVSWCLVDEEGGEEEDLMEEVSSDEWLAGGAASMQVFHA